MTKQIGDKDGRSQQGDTPDLRSQYRAIGIQAISAAAALCKDKKAKPTTQQQSQAIIDFQD